MHILQYNVCCCWYFKLVKDPGCKESESIGVSESGDEGVAGYNMIGTNKSNDEQSSIIINKSDGARYKTGLLLELKHNIKDFDKNELQWFILNDNVMA